MCVSETKLNIQVRWSKLLKLPEIEVDLYGVCFSDQVDGVVQREQDATAVRD